MDKKNYPLKICIVAPVHIWDDVRVFHKEAKSLAQFGFDVSLIARTEGHKIVEGVKLISVKTSKKNRFLRFFMLPRVLKQALNQGADIYHLHNPDTLPIGICLKILGKKIVYDTHEDFTKRIQTKEWIPRMLRKPIAKLIGYTESFFCKLFDGAIATQQEVVARLGSKAVLIQNPPRNTPSLIEKVQSLKKEIKDSFQGLRVIYIGGIAESRGLFTMVDAMERVNKNLNVRLWLIGKSFNNKIEIARNRKGWKYVDHIDRIPQERAFAYVAKSDLGLIILKPTGGHEYIDPNKIYEYMTFGVPFIASDFKVWREKIGKNNAGWFVEPDSPLLLSKKIEEAFSDKEKLKNYKKNALNFIKAYNWENESKKLLELYRNL